MAPVSLHAVVGTGQVTPSLRPVPGVLQNPQQLVLLRAMLGFVAVLPPLYTKGKNIWYRKEGHVLFNDALNTFYLRL